MQEANFLRAGEEVVPGYRLMKPLGKGGFGEVWQAEAQGGFQVALKFVRLNEPNHDLELRALAILRALRHPKLLVTFGAWQIGNFLVVGMEMADRTVWDRYREARDQGLPGIPAEELSRYLADAAEAIDFLNEPRHLIHGKAGVAVQHRDIKPQNLLLVKNGVKVGDFGLAKVLEETLSTNTGALTPAYAPPEFFHGQTASQSDQYSLAVTYCQLRGGQLPFRGDLAALMAGHVGGTPDLSMIPEEERPAVQRALNKNPAQRWPTCGDFAAAVRAARDTRRTMRATSPLGTTVDWPGRQAVDRRLLLLFLLLLLGGLATAWLIWLRRESGEQPPGEALALLVDDVRRLHESDRLVSRYVLLPADEPDRCRQELEQVLASFVPNARKPLLEPTEAPLLHRIDLRRLGWHERPMAPVNGNGKQDPSPNLYDLILLEYPEATIDPDSPHFRAAFEEYLRPAGMVRPIPYVHGTWLAAELKHGFLSEDLRRVPLGQRQLPLPPRREQAVRQPIGVPLYPLDGLGCKEHGSSSGLAQVDLTTNRAVFTPGDVLEIRVKNRCAVPIFAELIGTDAKGAKASVLPGIVSLGPGAERIQRLTISDALGKEEITLFAAPESFPPGRIWRGPNLLDRIIHPLYQLEGKDERLQVYALDIVKKTVQIETRAVP